MFELVEAACCSDDVRELVTPWVEYVGILDVLERLEKVDEWTFCEDNNPTFDCWFEDVVTLLRITVLVEGSVC